MRNTHLHPTRRNLIARLTATLAFALGTGLTGLTTQALAADFPERPIKLISPYAPGGIADPVGRALAEGMAQDLGQSLVVENKPGAGTMIGAAVAANAPPKGYTLPIATNVLVLNHTSSNTTAAGFGTAVVFQVQLPAGGSPVAMGRVSAGLATAGAGTEQGRVDLLPAFAGTVAPVGIRTRAPSAAALLVNGLEVLPITAGAPATATGVSLAPYGATADVSLSLRPKGAGRTMLRDSGDTLMVLGVERVGSGALSGIVAWSSTATGATSATLNATSGVVTFTDDAATTLTITNTLVTTASLIFVNMQTATSNAVNIRRAVPTLDTITIELSGAPGVTNYAISFLVVNPAT